MRFAVNFWGLRITDQSRKFSGVIHFISSKPFLVYQVLPFLKSIYKSFFICGQASQRSQWAEIKRRSYMVYYGVRALRCRCLRSIGYKHHVREETHVSIGSYEFNQNFKNIFLRILSFLNIFIDCQIFFFFFFLTHGPNPSYIKYNSGVTTACRITLRYKKQLKYIKCKQKQTLRIYCTVIMRL